VAEVRAKYENLGRKIFRPPFPLMRTRAKYRDGPLTEELEAYFGRDRMLGDPQLQTLLSVVCTTSRPTRRGR
jgi:hypothetical protein